MPKPFLAIFLFFISPAFLIAQVANDNISRAERGEDDKFLYRNEQSFGLFIHSAGGFGGVYRRAKHVTGTRKKMFEIELTNFRHPKEVKSMTSSLFFSSGSFYYGKLNSVLLLRGGVGYQNVIYRKEEKKNVEVRYVTMVGATLAFAKPVYLYVRYTDTANQQQQGVRKYNPELYKYDDIVGKAKFSQGLGNTKLVPAAYLRLGLSFDFAERYDAVKSLEVGGVMDAYPKALELIAYDKPKHLLFSLYLKMTWGSKWY